MASLAAGIVDPTKAGKYPVVLSDALLGKDPKEVFTGVRYNHKPSLSSSTAPAQARIKSTSASSSKKGASTYDLAFQDDGGRYQYKGTRGVEDNQYVLIFDPAREVFVLHKVDSMFNMNLVKTPSNDDPESLRQEFPHLDAHSAASSAKATGPARQPAKGRKEEKKTAAKPRKPASKPKAEDKPVLAMPEKKSPPKPITTSKPRRTSDDSEEESSDDDLGLTIENPGGEAPRVNQHYSPNLFGIRRFSDLMNEGEDEKNNEEYDDADGEEDDDEPIEHFVLPSPINQQMHQTSNAHKHPQTNEECDEDEDEEMEDVQQEQPAEAEEPALDESDLEAALLAELGEEDQQESDVSEEE
ncbi:RNA polymerase II transcription elongation factor-domain-containing protein [Daldinia decipiens]|uniref:RNA polymerase II transcription elongation factor-domain-containing protein n=1 Tax=Daldinia decipiens TaxID=326647 RepID=UPI0020C2E490|nr:RNA polymerase II transcription elongation factor-domain-containing protein [Daldinia decipiens]KAI1654654.1 RNA polymerase II transcription elongation factor-domain-containing protein [Daldinia decipiens]